ncbi:MAG: hypothetical protein M3R48_10150 [Candidatus Dormibacteraeota bacterium]|nr:hypothetical protein [Candidatus Dormibacteraeota bacterium]
MIQVTPADRDRARRRIVQITVAAASVAVALTLGGAAAAAGTFAGRTVSTNISSPGSQGSAVQPTLDPNAGLQPPVQVPGDGSGGVSAGGGVPSGGS